MIAEISFYAADYAALEPVQAVAVGGGMPSLLSLEHVHRIMQTLRNKFDCSRLEEITFALSPAHASRSYLEGLRAAGINRMSLDIRSFFEDDLEQSSAPHTAAQTQDLLNQVRSAGFDNYSTALLLALPDQPEEYRWANLERVVREQVPHIYTYDLVPAFDPSDVEYEIEPAAVHERFRFAMDYLQSRGYEHYELGCFALPGRHSVQVEAYSEQVNHIGFGPSARSAWRKPLPDTSIFLWTNVSDIGRYQRMLEHHHLPLESKIPATLDDLADGYVISRLRTDQGLDLNLFELEYGVDLLTDRIDELALLETEGMIYRIRNGRVRLTDDGKINLGYVLEQLLELEE